MASKVNYNENAKIMTVVGGQGGGKSYATIQMAKMYVEKRQMPVIFIDTKDEPDFRQFTTIYYNPGTLLKGNVWDKTRLERAAGKLVTIKGKKYQNGIISANKAHIYRLLCEHEDGSPFNKAEIVEMVLTISENYRNGLLVLEEMNSYFRGYLPNEFFAFFTNVRKQGVDLVLHFQALGNVYPDIWGNTKIMRLHSTLDSIAEPYLRQKAATKYAFIQIAENIIRSYSERTADARNELVGVRGQNNINRVLRKYKVKIGEVFFFMYIDFEKRKLLGEYTQRDFNLATQTFLWQNPREITDLMRIEENGKPLYANKEDAMQYLIKNKYSKYSKF